MYNANSHATLCNFTSFLVNYLPQSPSVRLWVTASQSRVQLRSQSRNIPRPVAVTFPALATSLAAKSGSPVSAIANQYNSSTSSGAWRFSV